MLRNKRRDEKSVEKPLQNLLMTAALKKPLEHFQEKKEKVQIEENVEPLKFIQNPKNNHKLENFLMNYSNEVLAP